MKSIFVALLLFLQVLCGYSQQQASTTNSKVVAVSDETILTDKTSAMPEYPGGEKALHKFIYKNVKYPATARDEKTQGQVTVHFMIDVDGSVKNATVPEGKGIGNGCDEEAIRVVMLSPKWKPAKRVGAPIAVWYEVPITFALSDTK